MAVRRKAAKSAPSKAVVEADGSVADADAEATESADETTQGIDVVEPPAEELEEVTPEMAIVPVKSALRSADPMAAYMAEVRSITKSMPVTPSVIEDMRDDARY